VKSITLSQNLRWEPSGWDGVANFEVQKLAEQSIPTDQQLIK